MRYRLSSVVLEAEDDLCCGISKANTAVIYPGYDNHPGSLKTRLTLQANRDFSLLCEELQVPFSRCGSLMVSFGDRGTAVLKKKYENGCQSGVPGLRLLSGEEARTMEGSLAPTVKSALFAPTTGTVNPWQLCYAAAENAKENGCEFRMGTRLLTIEREGEGYRLVADRGELLVRAVINCAGLSSHRVHEMLFPPSVRIFPDGGDYLVLERGSLGIGRVIFRENEDGKGLTAVPTVEGSILLGPADRAVGSDPRSTTEEGLTRLMQEAETLFPAFSRESMIRSFAAVRPNPHYIVWRNGALVPDGRSIGSFVIERAEERFISLIGIKTPGLTCADGLGRLVAGEVAEALDAPPRTDFDPERKAPPRLNRLIPEARAALAAAEPRYGRVVCLCEDVSEAEIREAIRQGAVTVDGVKRRCGASLGVCQGSRCRTRIARILAEETGLPLGHFLGEEADGA